MLKIFNTLTKKKEKVQFSYSKIINIYVCGVTVYDLCHIGHARTFLVFDIIKRYLEYLGYKTCYVRNITDIDDKIIYTANRNNESIDVLVKRMIKHMHKDFLCLNLQDPDYEPKVTRCMQDIISFIEILLKKNFAYIADNKDILFSIKQYNSYGILSRRKKLCCLHDTVSYDDSIYNESNDFVLWKHSINKSDPHWISPWGPGRPGWHIECSAIINKFFKNGVNIHGGGIDLLFPHHENELAQLKSIKSSFSIKFWIHVGMVIINNHKMSKSLSNTVFIRDLLHKYDPEVIRFYILSTHYRHPLVFREKNLNASQNILKKIYVSLLYHNIQCTHTNDQKKLRNTFKEKFFSAMNDDFNTPKACLILQKLSQYINKIKKSRDILLYNSLSKDLIFFGNVLGLLNHDPKNFLRSFTNKMSRSQINIVEKLVRMRDSYRNNKKWNLADMIRKKLLKLGVTIKDGNERSTYKFIYKN
ncbi:Cysteine--tRNA ligase [Buchnera aphidicola (Cinara pseudotaxifoliae)]|uniref:Cysteine--tRNA ligase n=1 Tax=Buchnera aphidicola (Cinara pseudotaxifoliae) TaxID=655384 RepID=A0A451DHL8_9GAMM|nr:cysteine--tRNA ligase [Buchnera aphidicola]VFP86125.1 Cysteine--tRNA ligase [Buchnera aphidicola (Cinara pseudotaxifoliae)]